MKKYLLTSRVDLLETCPSDIRSGEVHYISPSCFYGKAPAARKAVEGNILSSPFDDTQLDTSFQAISAAYKNIITQLAGLLNGIHATNFSVRYWEVLVSFWLIYFLSSVYERFLRLHHAEVELGNECRVIATSMKSPQPPLEINDYNMVLESNIEDFDFVLYSDIAKNMNLNMIYIDQTDTPLAIKESQIHPQILRARSKAKNILTNCIATFDYIARGNCSIYLANFNIFKKIFPRACIVKYKDTMCSYNEQIRKDILNIEGSNDFENVISKMLPRYLPASLLESYQNIRQQAKKYIDKGLFISPSSVWDDTNVVFNFAASESREKRCGLRVLMQHGGGDGQNKYFLTEYVGRRTSDVYFTFGWKDQYYDGAILKTGPNILLSRQLKKNKKTDHPKKRALFVSTSGSPFLYRNNHWTLIEGMEEYFSRQFDFCEAINEDILSNLSYRPYPWHKYEWDHNERFKKKFHKVLIDNEKDIFKSLSNSRVVILDHNSTTNLYVMAINVPTIWYWSPHFYSLRESSSRDFQKLKKVGILYDTPEEAACKINEIWHDISSWWFSSAVQEVRGNFAEKYCFSSENYRKMWKTAIGNLRTNLLSQ